MAAPIAWFAPPRFSTITCSFHALWKRCAISRAITSVTPPGAAGTTMVIGLLGNDCA
jgi:hypothetical protein